MAQRRAVTRTAAALAAVVAMAGCGGTEPVDLPSEPVQPPSASGSTFFATSGLWSGPVRADTPVDPRSDRYVAKLAGLDPVITVRSFTVTVLVADDTAPRFTITPLNRRSPGFRIENVPIPAHLTIDPADNGHLAILDSSSKCVYELYGAQYRNSAWTADWVNATPTDGDGIYQDGLSPRGSGFATTAGLIWPDELRSGNIPHALVFSYPFTRSGGPVAPATRSDGRSTDAGALPIGAHLVLDPAVDVEALPIPDQDKVIARALQRYGMILADTSGGFTLYAVHPQSFSADPYQALWGDTVWADMKGIPFDRMRVLAMGPQQKPYDGPPLGNRCNRDTPN